MSWEVSDKQKVPWVSFELPHLHLFLTSVGIWLSILVPCRESSASNEELEELGSHGGGKAGGRMLGRVFALSSRTGFLVSLTHGLRVLHVVKSWC